MKFFCESVHFLMETNLKSFGNIEVMIPSFSIGKVKTVVSVIWARVCSLTLKGARFRMRITLGVVLNSPLVCAICVPGCLRSGSGLALN